MDLRKRKRIRNRNKLPKGATRFHHTEDNQNTESPVDQVIKENNRRAMKRESDDKEAQAYADKLNRQARDRKLLRKLSKASKKRKGNS